jgi:biopolymer transport protein ExbD
MAEMITKTGRGRRAVPRVDLTAMVDLGFLLITFFMLATTLATPKSMEIIKPALTKDTAPLKNKNAFTVLVSNEKIYYYSAPDDASIASVKIDSTTFGGKGIRKVLMEKMKNHDAMYGHGSSDKIFFMIKALSNAKLHNMVAILDEMKILDAKRFSIIDEFNPIDETVNLRISALKESK